MSIKQSVCIPILPQDVMPRERLFAEIAAIGYPAIEIWQRGDDFVELCQTAADCGLQLISMIGHDSLPDGLNNAGNHDRIESELRESVDLAVAHGLRALICFSGNHIAGMSNEEAIANTVAGLRRVAPYAEDNGIVINLELLNSKVDHPNYQCDNSAWGLEVQREVGSPNVKLLFDIYHMQIMEGDVLRTITDNLDAIGHMHTAGNPGRNELDDFQELNYRGICRVISDAGYDGYIGHEFRPRGDLVGGLRQAFEICNVD
ncbi:MAG: TIM barrel protein [Caldilineaceae bacterium]|nr:TIM barrel protein [Caldilineaceae bacterium]